VGTQLCYYKLIAWLFGGLVIKLMTPYPRQVCGILPQTCLGLRGHLITNLPQAMLLLIIMGQHLNFQHSFWDVIQEVTYHCIWTIISVDVILCDKRILLERGLPPYTLKSPNKQLMHTFLHFVVSLQSRFYTLALIFVIDVHIFSSSLRLFKIDHVVSFLTATHGQYFILALSLPLRWLRVTVV
jgi:hypothetical protein